MTCEKGRRRKLRSGGSATEVCFSSSEIIYCSVLTQRFVTNAAVVNLVIL